jgi:hypothetical protein
VTPAELSTFLFQTFDRVEHIKVGFTGTKRGMTSLQADKVEEILAEVRQLRSAESLLLGWPEFHHGDCVGADAGAHAIARRCGYRVVLHPPIEASLRAFCFADESREPAEYLTRNRDIVRETGLLIATPKRMGEEMRSGTWATVREARRHFTACLLVWVNGSVTLSA